MALFARWLAAATLASALIAPATSLADASTGALVCAFTAGSGQATGGSGAPLGPSSGAFGFTSPAVVCGGPDVAGASFGAVIPAVLPENFSITFGTWPPPPATSTTVGDYTSNVCSVGRAEGSFRMTGNAGNSTALTGRFGIDFAGPAARLQLTGLAGVLALNLNSTGTLQEVDHGEGDGALSIVPLVQGGAGICLGQGGFRADGVFDLTFGGDGQP
jgi:hypothetical protein